MPTDTKGREGFFGLPFFVLWLIFGLAWTWFGALYDLRWPGARLLLSTGVALASYLMMVAGLGVVGILDRDRKLTAIYSVLPWNGVYLFQLPYFGFFFIPLETGVCASLLKRRTSLSWTQAVMLAILVRGLSLGLTLLGTDLLRRVWMR